MLTTLLNIIRYPMLKTLLKMFKTVDIQCVYPHCECEEKFIFCRIKHNRATLYIDHGTSIGFQRRDEL